MNENISGKVVVITGASSGLGAATARLLSKQGATVVLASQGEPEPRARAAAAVTLRVIEGPDAGAAFALQNGSHVLGRDAGTDVTLSDPLVSKRHARVDVASPWAPRP